MNLFDLLFSGPWNKILATEYFKIKYYFRSFLWFIDFFIHQKLMIFTIETNYLVRNHYFCYQEFIFYSAARMMYRGPENSK